jgi:hypothetical protein
MAKGRARVHFSIQEKVGARLTGPVGPIPVGMRSEQSATLYIYQFSEILVCDYLSEGEEWVRTPLEIKRSSDLRFPRGTVQHIHMMAWLCAMSCYYPFDAENVGWAVDNWNAEPKTYQEDPEGEYINVTISVGAGPKGSRFNRIGYSWTVYAISPLA